MRPHASLALAFALGGIAAAAPTVARAADLASRTFRETFPAGQTVRLANLAGRVDLVPAPSGPLSVAVTVHARGEDAAETQRLLTGVRWIKSRDGKGREELALSYPVDGYRGFCYPRPERERADIPA